MVLLSPDCLSPDPLHPQSSPEEDPLFHRPAGPAAPHPLWLWNVTPALHEDDLPPHHDRDDSHQVGSLAVFFSLSPLPCVFRLGLLEV